MRFFIVIVLVTAGIAQASLANDAKPLSRVAIEAASHDFNFTKSIILDLQTKYPAQVAVYETGFSAVQYQFKSSAMKAILENPELSRYIVYPGGDHMRIQSGPFLCSIWGSESSGNHCTIDLLFKIEESN